MQCDYCVSLLITAEEEDLPPFQKPQPVEDKTEDQLSEASSVCASPAFPLTGLEGKVSSVNSLPRS